MICEIIPNKDSRESEPDFVNEKLKKLRGLQSRGVWEEVWATEVPEDANIMRSRFVLTIKEKGIPNEICKARFVEQGFRDAEKLKTVHFACLVRPESLQLTLSMATANNWMLGTIDVTQAYLQGEHLPRDVYLQPPEELSKKGKLIHLVKPLYALTDSGDLWYTALTNYLQSVLNLTHTTGDSGMYYDARTRAGLLSTYVDDLLIAGSSSFLENLSKIQEKSQYKEPKYSNFTYGGVQLEHSKEGTKAYQGRYASSIKLLALDSSFE